MRAMLMRELIVSARRAAAPITVCVVSALLISFVLVWWPGVPVLAAPASLYEQTRILHWVVLAVALPWTAVRAAPHDRGDNFVLMSALTGVAPTSVVAGKILSTFVVLVLIILTGLPPLIIAQQAAAVSAGTVVFDLLPCAGLALLVAASSTASILVLRDSIFGWLATTTVTGVVLIVAVSWTPDTMAVGTVCGLVGGIASAAICAWSNGSLRYLGDAGAA